MLFADGGRTSTIYADDRTDRERWRCPNNHKEWEPTANGAGIHCVACARLHDVGPRYESILDTQSDDRLDWNDIVLVYDSGTGERVSLRGRVKSLGGELAVGVPEAFAKAIGLESGGTVRLERDQLGDPQEVAKIVQN